MTEIENRYTHYPVCPYCGYEYKSARDDIHHDTYLECPSCEKEYFVSLNIEYTYSTLRNDE